MRAVYYQKFFEGGSRKFSKFENDGNIFESFGIPRHNLELLALNRYDSDHIKWSTIHSSRSRGFKNTRGQSLRSRKIVYSV